MGDAEDEQENRRVSPVFILGLLLAVVGLWWAFQTEPAEPAPGCRFVGKFQQCETPAPHETETEPPSDPYEDAPFAP